MNYRLLSIADAELAEAARWYETQAPGLGQEFLDEFEAVMDRIMRFPEAWRRIGTRHRRCLLRRFPYAVLYSQSETEITVAGVIDLRRDPQRMEKRRKTT
ncbi:MAG: type II toxin-antitoxin system RelE/ParE family toxin [Verrucomicrobia bacterium]|nr:type II toxin-antitoxin system RelE/ParE family toxin [Verrucomicrobiota bacterium]